jgi:hypothetical protein
MQHFQVTYMQKAVTTLVLVVSQIMKQVMHMKLVLQKRCTSSVNIKTLLGYNATICIRIYVSREIAI